MKKEGLENRTLTEGNPNRAIQRLIDLVNMNKRMAKQGQ